LTLTPQLLLVSWSRKIRAIPVLPLWAVRPAQCLSACTRVHFTLRTFYYVIKTYKIIFTKFQLLLCMSWRQSRVEVHLHSFLNSATNGVWLVRFMTRPLFPYGKSPQVLFEYEAG